MAETKETPVVKERTPNTWEVLVIDPRKCVGCEICESVCSFAHDEIFNPINSRIYRVRIEPVVNSVLACLKCQDPACVESCELNALSQDNGTGVITTDYDICDGCGSCVKACPYGVITIHSIDNKAIMCDLCESTEYDTPQCVDYCPKDAIYVEEIYPLIDDERLDTLEKILKRGFPGEGMLN